MTFQYRFPGPFVAECMAPKNLVELLRFVAYPSQASEGCDEEKPIPRMSARLGDR